MINVNWIHLGNVRNKLQKEHKLTDNSVIIFHFIPFGHKKKKCVAKFKDFLKFIWTLYDNPNIKINNLVVTNEKGDAIFEYLPVNIASEQKPITGDGRNILMWNKLKTEAKEVLLKILITEINYDN